MGAGDGEPATPPGDVDEEGHTDHEQDGERHADRPDGVHEEAFEVAEEFHVGTLASGR